MNTLYNFQDTLSFQHEALRSEITIVININTVMLRSLSLRFPIYISLHGGFSAAKVTPYGPVRMSERGITLRIGSIYVWGRTF